MCRLWNIECMWVMLNGKSWRLPWLWNLRCRCKRSTEGEEPCTKRFSRKGEHWYQVSCQHRKRGHDPKPAGHHSACKNLRPADGEIFQSRGHARGKRAAPAGRTEVKALPGTVFAYRGRCHWRGLKNWKAEWRNGGCLNILCFSYFAGILRFPQRFISRDKIR